jgi:hypothetical protein
MKGRAGPRLTGLRPVFALRSPLARIPAGSQALLPTAPAKREPVVSRG